MTEKVYAVPADFAAQANITSDQYQEMYQRSVDDPEGFWAEQANEYLSWFKPWDKVLDDSNKPFYRWFAGGELNTCHNALDRHVESGRAEQAALARIVELDQ